MNLTRCQTQIAVGFALGRNTKTLALELGITPKTVECHRTLIYRPLHLRCLAQLTRWCIRNHLLNL